MARTILIDPPVGPYSPPDEIRTWIDELLDRLSDVENEDDRAAFREAIDRARSWLDAGES